MTSRQRKQRVPLFPLIVLILVIGYLVVDGLVKRGQAPPKTATVTRVVDGDTIKVESNSGSDTVRYIGIDTPESVKPNTPVQCYAKKASKFNSELVLGKRVRLVFDNEKRDRYGRLLAYIYIDNPAKTFVNGELVRRGYAMTLSIPPNTAKVAKLDELQTEAERKDRGLWKYCQ